MRMRHIRDMDSKHLGFLKRFAPRLQTRASGKALGLTMPPPLALMCEVRLLLLLAVVVPLDGMALSFHTRCTPPEVTLSSA